jgi:receptor expression-enhancing protein 5/6
VRLTGAGDCLVGGTLASICAGLDIMQSVSVGIAVAKAAVEVEANVPSSFSLAAIAGNILSSMHLIIVYIALALEIKGVSGV